MIEPRLYRAALLPVLLAAVVLAFSLEPRPAPLSQGLAADVLFDGRLASAGMRRLVAAAPDRRPGTPGSEAAAKAVEADFRRHEGFLTDVDRFTSDGTPLANVVARRAGTSRRQIVVAAGRDAASVPDAPSSAADTAALLELARVLEGRPARRTIVLASLGGRGGGTEGARQLVRSLPDPGLVDAVVVVSHAAAQRSRGPLIVPWSTDDSPSGVALRRTASASLAQELRPVPADDGLFMQLARLAFPLGIGAQGPLLEEGLESIRVSGSGELPPGGGTELADVDQQRLGDTGRTALRVVSALDTRGAPERGHSSYLLVAGNVLPAWAAWVLAAALVIPLLLVAVDAFARARRRRIPFARPARDVLAAAVPFAVALGCAELAVLGGLAPDLPAQPLPPSEVPLGTDGAVAMGIVLVGATIAWLVGPSRLIRPRWAPGRTVARNEDDSKGAGVAAALLLAAATACVWMLNPWAALVLAPALHLWTVALLAGPPARRGTALLLLALGLLPPALVALLHMSALDLGPLAAPWYLFGLVTGHHVGLATALAGCLWLGAAGATAALFGAARTARREAPEAPPPTTRGPASYAGPGSLGGTDSAFRR